MLDHFLYRLKYRYGQHLPLTVPVDVSLELSSACNMSCVYCYHNDKHTPFVKGMMEKGVALKIIRESAHIGVNSLKFNWKGESSLHPAFWDITTYAKRLAKGSTFQERLSNSNFKFPTKHDHIFDAFSNQTKVKISYDSFDKGVFETQRAGGNHDVTTANIDKFYNWKNRKDTQIVIQSVRTSLNKDEDIEGLAKKRWPEASISIREVVDGRKDESIGDLVNVVRSKGRIPCKQAFVRLIFNHKGIAHPCCPDIKEEIELGDINNMSVREIFNGYEAMKIRSDLTSGKAFMKDPCRTCSSHESYAGYSAPWGS